MIWDMLHDLILGPPGLLIDTVYALGFRLTGSPGLSIVLLSLAVNLLLLPLYRRADLLQRQEQERAARLKPWADRIRKTFRGDERFMILQTYYRQNRYKPYGALKGALSLLLEVPFFMAAYRFLSGLSLLDGAAFGPIRDLGRPDGLLSLGGASLHLLPVLMTVLSIASGALYTRGLPRKESLRLYGMALVFLVLLYNAPAGLALYWTLNNAFSLARNLIRRAAGRAGRAKAAEGGAEAGRAENAGPEAADGRANRSSLPVFLCAALLLALLTGVLIPSAVVGASPGEFVILREFHDPLRFVLSSALKAAGAFLLWGGLIYRLSSGRARRRLASCFAAAAAAAAVDYLFFGRGYGNLSPALRYDGLPAASLSECLLNLGALAAVSGLVLLLRKKGRDALTILLAAACASVGILSTGNIRDIRTETAALRASAEREREKPAPSFALSREGKNVVVIMLDRCISGFLPYILEENPAVAEQLRGFTYYPNTLAFGRNTNVCTPSLYGGYEYRPFELDKRDDLGLPEKQNEALKVMPVLFSENGFEVTVCDPPYAGYLWIPDLSIYDEYPDIRRFNTCGAFTDAREAFRKMSRTLERNLFCYGLLRAAPVPLHAGLYDRGRYNSSEALALAEGEAYGAAFSAESELRSSGISEEFMKAYTALQHLPDMTELPEGGGGKSAPENTFLILSNTTTHDVTLLQEPAFEPHAAVDNTAYEAARGVRHAASGEPLELKTLDQMEHYQCDTAAMIQLSRWFSFLRENGVWDNTRIIVVSDHGWELGLSHLLTGRAEGENGLAPYDGVMAYNALLMVKDFGSVGPLRTDPAFRTIADTPSEAMRGLIENPVNPFTGNPVTADARLDEEQYVMLTDWRIAENHGTRYADPVRLTLRNGSVRDESCWVLP